MKFTVPSIYYWNFFLTFIHFTLLKEQNETSHQRLTTVRVANSTAVLWTPTLGHENLEKAGTPGT